ncbi:MAG TPA: hypothetical protein VFI25_11275 [Planctomycetota bacterium]|jgi:hypothetical protein|nr:hypothetical protein [Planctomycetota bacterium]
MTAATARRDEVAADLAQTKQRHAAASAALGRAVAEGRDAAGLRAEAHDLQVRIEDLEAALPATEDLIREEEARAEAERLAAAAAAREERRKRREAAARRFDAAIAAAGAAFDEWFAASPEGHWKIALRNAVPYGLVRALDASILSRNEAPLAACERKE